MLHRIVPLQILMLVALATLSFGQTTSDTTVIGGPGAHGCQQGDPPTLTGGVPASATITHDYDAATAMLTVTVTNTSEVIAGVPNPVISRVDFNAPSWAISDLILVNQTAAGGAAPNFSMMFDNNLLGGSSLPSFNCFGSFSVSLLSGGNGPQGGIANANAGTLGGPPGSAVIGPVVFEFQVVSAAAASLSATAFSNSLSQGGSNQATAAMKFVSGGPGGNESGIIGNALDCEPAGFVIGAPSLGSTVFLAQSGQPGCSGCIVGSLDPGPTLIDGYMVPIGLPAQIITSAAYENSGISMVPIFIPDNQLLVGLTVYFVVINTNANVSEITISDRYEMTIIP